ncbi:hypothetical protein V8D89_002625 [Ganoderma adspersum]
MVYKRRSNYISPAATAVMILAALSSQPAKAGNTTCVSNQLSWYSDVVGESPCMTYQRLRQICNNDYQVPSFSSTVPGDRCDDQVSECCCNMVAFQLSMLCMVCQQDKQDSGGIGIDAPTKGTYTVYRGSCGAGVNHTLPSDLQSGICNENIRIDNFLYDSWDDGTCVWTKENVEKLHAANNNNTFTHCPDQISPSPTPTTTSTSSTAQQTTQAVPTSDVSSIGTPVTSVATTSTPMSSRGSASISPSPFILKTSGIDATIPPTGVSTQISSANSTTSSESSSSAQPTDADFGAGGQSKSKSHTSIIGGVVGGVVGLLLIALAGIVWRRRKTIRERNSHFEPKSTPTAPRFAAPAGSLAPNRLVDIDGRPTSRIADDDDPFNASETSPRSLAGTPSNPFDPTPTATQPLAGSTPLTEMSLRHHDGGPLLGGLTRSNSGRLPPAYEDSWDSHRSRRTHPSASLSAGPQSDFPGSSEFSASETQTTDVVPPSAAYGSTTRDDPSSIGPRTLPTPGLSAVGDSDSKDSSVFN